MSEFGPFHRKKAPKQRYDDVLKQEASSEIWGKPLRLGGLFPKVKAYSMPLCFGIAAGIECADGEGIEFVTAVPPSEVLPNGVVYWTLGETPVPGLRKIDDETIALTVTISKVVYSERGEKPNEPQRNAPVHP
ncbi:hypothetical protein ASC89_00245 [Devosia sp. Root413D1]|nr:hypothetical protein ASC89_00245 [Devosia sp. Root413D1]